MRKANKGWPWVGASICAALLSVSGGVQAATAHVAVAANFTDAAKELAQVFAEQTEHEVMLSFGATGQFYTQIANDAPFEVFLAADNIRPQRAVDEGLGVDGSVFTYATGQLVLYSATDDIDLDESYLQNAAFSKIAMANPDTAPYGVAAVETLEHLDLYDALKDKVIQGQNIGQTFQFVETGNAELGFVAMGQIAANNKGSRWVVPADFYTPIEQDAVLLEKGKDNPAATEFLGFLQSAPALAIIKSYGYAVTETQE